MSGQESRTIHYTELTPLPSDHVLYHEYNTYLRELARLLAEGLEGKFALIKGQTILGIFDQQADAFQAGRDKFPLEPFMVQPIRADEPILRVPWLYFAPCRI